MTMPRLTIQRLGLADVNSSFNAIENIELADIPGPIADSVIAYAKQDPNEVFAGPSSGSVSDEPEFRALVMADLPDGTALSVLGRASNTNGDHASIVAANDAEVLRRSGTSVGFGSISAASIGSGTLGLARGGTNADLSATGGTKQFLKQTSAGAAITVGTAAITDLSDVTDVTDVAFNAANFTASSGNWTLASGDQTTFAYAIHGKMMTVWFFLVTTTVSSTPSDLRITIPASKVISKSFIHGNLYLIDNGGTAEQGYIVGSATSTFLQLSRYGATWSVATDTTQVGAVVTFPIQ